MRNVVWALLVLSILSFLLAVIGSLTGNWLLGINPEGYSRACSNLALIAVVLHLVSKGTHERE